MRLLVVNFEMDPASPVLAWQHKVVLALAPHCEQVVVLTQRAAAGPLPDNVEVRQIPTWFAKAPFRWFGAKWLANIQAYRLCRSQAFDACFVHMSMEWAYRLYPCLRFFGIPILLWYAHGSVTWRLRLAHWCADRVVTSSPEGFRLPSKKLQVIGQGIDTALFKLVPTDASTRDVLSVSRISASKHIDRMVEAVAELKKRWPADRIRLRIAGRPLTREDARYRARLLKMIDTLDVADCVEWLGHVPLARVPELYRSAFAQINLSATGSMDKSLLEALACGCPTVSSNRAIVQWLKANGREDLCIVDESPPAIAAMLHDLYRRRASVDRAELRRLVEREHDLDGYVRRLLAQFDVLTASAKRSVEDACRLE